ncbi:MAG: hypothetical protein KF715_04990 [Candidatus Didemnitutus sp.]|nr:hypothetical protein [Candidatus Didemnitutus sp.]
MKSAQPPIYETATGLARRAGVHRAVVLRLLAQNMLPPAAFVAGLGGAITSPLFSPDQAVDVLRLQKVSYKQLATAATHGAPGD